MASETVRTFLRFSFKIQKHDFLRFLSCCTRFREHCRARYGRSYGQNIGVQHINFVQEEYVMKREKRDSYAGGADIRDGDFQGRGEEGGRSPKEWGSPSTFVWTGGADIIRSS